MRKRDAPLEKQLLDGLVKHEARRPLPGISTDNRRGCLVAQLIDSVRRVKYPPAIAKRTIAESRRDPGSDYFDPLRAAILQDRDGNADEAFWLVFLFVLFGRSATSGYQLARDIYGGIGSGGIWTWKRLNEDFNVFDKWVLSRIKVWKGDGVARGLGPHRRRERLATVPQSAKSYMQWVNTAGSHQSLMRNAVQSTKNAREAFDFLYKSMDVHRFGRLAKFDYLSMIGKLGFANIEPASTYVLEASGPLSGARLIYGGNSVIKTYDASLEKWLIELGSDLGIGQQEVEDAICNWQKHPDHYERFNG